MLHRLEVVLLRFLVLPPNTSLMSVARYGYVAPPLFLWAFLVGAHLSPLSSAVDKGQPCTGFPHHPGPSTHLVVGPCPIIPSWPRGVVLTHPWVLPLIVLSVVFAVTAFCGIGRCAYALHHPRLRDKYLDRLLAVIGWSLALFVIAAIELASSWLLVVTLPVIYESVSIDLYLEVGVIGVIVVVLLVSYRPRRYQPFERTTRILCLAASFLAFAAIFDWFVSQRYPHIFYIGSVPGPITKTQAAYFAVTVFTTLGLGDVHPFTDPGRIVLVVQSVLGFIVLGVGIARTVGAASSPSVADELSKLVQLRASGVLSEKEFAVQKARVLR